MTIEQRVHSLNHHPKLATLARDLQNTLPDLLAEAERIQQIAAPTFNELVRANHVLSRLGECGLQNTAIDAAYNTFGLLEGTDPTAPALLVSAHTDTVFTAETDLTTRRENDRLYGPGIGDNSLGVAALIALADLLRRFDIHPARSIWFLANSREEGLGDLGGIRAFYDSHGSRLGHAIVLEGMALGGVYHAGIAVRRLHITCTAEGGHSWQHFGRPTAIHSLLRLGAQITEIDVPLTPRTTYNIGVIEGGQSVNSLAQEAGLYLDMRSETPEGLAALEQQVMDIIDGCNGRDTNAHFDVVGDRPAGQIDPAHDLVQAAIAALDLCGQEAALQSGSTDANLLLANGLPTVTIGITHGRNAHRLDEYIHTRPITAGMRQLVLLALAAAGWDPDDDAAA